MGKPDYADILSRSLDMLDRKYDTTPEGRGEANKLALELELMEPAPVKPAKDYFGRVVDLVRRLREGEARKGAGGSQPPSLPPEAFLNCYGHPIKLAVPIEGRSKSLESGPGGSLWLAALLRNRGAHIRDWLCHAKAMVSSRGA